MVGIGLLYRRGYFRQRLDLTRPAAGVLARARPEVAADGARHARRTGRRSCSRSTLFGAPLHVPGLARRRRARAAAPPRRGAARERRRCSAGRRRGSTRATARFGSRSTGCSGSAGPACCDALGIEPAVDPPERGPSRARRARARRARGRGRRAARARRSRRVRERVVFTTHTPVAAGNETYARGGVPGRLRRARARGSGSTTRLPRPLPRRPGRRASAGDDAARAPAQPDAATASAALHGEVARADVAAAVPGHGRRRPDHARHERRPPPDVRLASRCATCFDGHLGDGWLEAPPHRESWEGVLGDPERRALGRPLRGPGAARRLRPRQGPSRTACCAASSSTTSAPIEESLEPGRADDRLRAPARHLQAAAPPRPRPGTRATHLHRRASRRSS